MEIVLIPDFFLILEMCFFYPWKSPILPEISWILGEVEALFQTKSLQEPSDALFCPWMAFVWYNW